MISSRRQFLMHSIGTTGLLAAGPTLPGFLSRTAHAAGLFANPGSDDSILVIIQLTGGNDGLNTVIPFTNDIYHRARPTLAVDENRVHKINDELGLHPEMGGMKELFDEGKMTVINNIGYPNPDRSHFRSMDIWHTGSLEPEGHEDGWLGRVVDKRSVGRETPFALHLDDAILPEALKARTRSVPSIRDIASFSLNSANVDLEQSIAQQRSAASDDLLYVQRVAVSSCRNAERLRSVSHSAAGSVEYPNQRLANRLQQIAQLIGADFGPRIYYTSIGGFDTHAQQILAHGPLLRQLSDSVTAFQRDLEARGVADKVVTMTFSEFGRRLYESGSRGTDHGAAAPMFIIGQPCKPGIIGKTPHLEENRSFDVAHEIDFRSVYATLLDRWIGVPHREVLGGRFDPLALLRA